MFKAVQAFLKAKPGSKARTIAHAIDEDKSAVSKFLHDHRDVFRQDEETYGWFILSPERTVIELTSRGWLTSGEFEDALSSSASVWEPSVSRVDFVVKDDCKILLEALARLLAMCNQLSNEEKQVTLDFESSKSTLSYLDRIGFFNILDDSIAVLPRRPAGRLAKSYWGNNGGVVELRPISTSLPSEDIPESLRKSFVACAGEDYNVAALTVLGELFDNVVEHADATTPGFAALQFYKRGNRIQTVISDNGRGIVGTLGPVLAARYPVLSERVRRANHAGVELLKEVFSSGAISRLADEGRGLGLKTSRVYARKYRAKIAVRQSDFELRIHHSGDRVRFDHTLDLAPMKGTHICFDFELDVRQNSG